MDIEQTLETLILYYDKSRQAGHTHTMEHGAHSPSSALVITDHLDALAARNTIDRRRLVPLSDLNRRLAAHSTRSPGTTRHCEAFSSTPCKQYETYAMKPSECRRSRPSNSKTPPQRVPLGEKR